MVFPLILVPFLPYILGAIALIAFAFLGTLIPAFGAIVIGVGIFLFGILSPIDLTVYEFTGKHSTARVSMKFLAVILGSGILLINFFGMSLANFVQGFGAGIGLSAGENALVQAASPLPNTFSILAVLIGALAIAALTTNKKLRKKLLKV